MTKVLSVSCEFEDMDRLGSSSHRHLRCGVGVRVQFDSGWGGFAFGFGAFIAFFGALSVLAHNRTPDHWGLVVVGLAMFTVPFIGNAYSYDRGPPGRAGSPGASP